MTPFHIFSLHLYMKVVKNDLIISVQGFPRDSHAIWFRVPR